MVSQTPTSLLLEPTAPSWAQRLALRLDKVFLNLFPTAPVRLWPVTKANLPAAADWPGAVVYVNDVKKLGISDGAAWRDAMGGLI
jgi:hypothetical protein